MRHAKLFALSLLMIPAFSSAAVSLNDPPKQAVLIQGGWSGAISATIITAYPLPASILVTRISFVQSTAGGGGAGTTVIRVTDGTSSCDATFACSATTGTNAALSAETTGACFFARGASVTLGFAASTCTSTQPGARGVVATGTLFP